MSMTQEEIEALMNDTISDTSNSSDEQSIDDLLAEIDGINEQVNDGTSSDYTKSIDNLLLDMDGIEISDKGNALEDDDFEALLAGIGGIVDNEPKVETKKSSESTSKSSHNSHNEEETIGSKIDKGIYPMPVEKEHKVVNQLNEVAEDSEEKASQIFDVLSFILDENGNIERESKIISSYIDDQIKLLETLNSKFPNIDIFIEKLQKSKDAKKSILLVSSSVNTENDKVFEAMELMQYHDINRQKIERVMAVIRKLSLYLSGLFEDDTNKPEVQIAKHISGDSSLTVSDDDLDSLIAEFNKA